MSTPDQPVFEVIGSHVIRKVEVPTLPEAEEVATLMRSEGLTVRIETVYNLTTPNESESDPVPPSSTSNPSKEDVCDKPSPIKEVRP